MRKVVLQMMTTLNGRLDDPDAWVQGISDDQYLEIDRLYATFDTILVGRKTYEEMFAYWPAAETEQSSSEINKSMARRMNSYKKFVFSNRNEIQNLEWNNAELILAHSDDDMIEFIRHLKTQPGGDIHLAGGAQLAQSMIRLALIDEYHFFVYPVISPGATWFELLDGKSEMTLWSIAAYKNGVVGLYYKP